MYAQVKCYISTLKCFHHWNSYLILLSFSHYTAYRYVSLIAVFCQTSWTSERDFNALKMIEYSMQPP